MKSKKLQRKGTRNVWFLSVGLVIVSTLLIVWFMPRTDAFNYEYGVGQPWRYGTLFATEKFNIQMSDSAVEAQHDSLQRVFQPYFNVNTTVLPAMRAKLLAMEVTIDGRTVQVQRDKVMRPVALHAAALLDSVYTRGILSPTFRDSLLTEGVESARLVRDNMAQSVPLSSTLTQQLAYRFIVEHTPDTAMARLLTELNLNTVLEDNLTYDVLKSEDELLYLKSQLSTGIGFVMANEKIVDRGDIITPETYLKLRSYEKVMREQNAENERLPYIIAGQVVMVLIILSVLMSYLHLFRRDYLEDMRSALLLYALLTLFCITGSQMVTRHFFHIFALPVCMLPIIVRVFLDSRTAYMFHTATVIIISLVLSYPFEFIILQVVAGIIAIQNLRELNQRSQIIHTALVITLTYVIFYAAYQLTLGVRLVDLDRSTLTFFLINGLLILFTYPLLWIIERGLGFVSDVTLVELTNINHPLLQRLAAEAPGTFQHSMQVANLAADVANGLGAKVQLVRTGALYHDIGKMERPVFFTENQSGANPHKHLPAQKSAEVIIRHVAHGLELAAQHNLPQAVRRFIATHHGAGLAKYFYVTYCNEHPDEAVDRRQFSYPGPNPETLEEAILMMCDGVEAASRSLSEYTEESIDALVDRIVDQQVADGFFTECDITFRQIAFAKSVLKERLRNIYHTRIVYPTLGES
ncbi:MAG: HDIG domain-containing protein [Bacteroidaceae bacterium]|nr:HDIG domain-containing protein [Bacteroidaceae bacterium]